MKDEQDVTLRIVNEIGRKVQFVLEPWGEVYDLEADGAFIVHFKGPAGDFPEVAVNQDSIEVWGWTGSTVRLFYGEVEVGVAAEERPRVPAYP